MGIKRKQLPKAAKIKLPARRRMQKIYMQKQEIIIKKKQGIIRKKQ